MSIFPNYIALVSLMLHPSWPEPPGKNLMYHPVLSTRGNKRWKTEKENKYYLWVLQVKNKNQLYWISAFFYPLNLRPIVSPN